MRPDHVEMKPVSVVSVILRRIAPQQPLQTSRCRTVYGSFQIVSVSLSGTSCPGRKPRAVMQPCVNGRVETTRQGVRMRARQSLTFHGPASVGETEMKFAWITAALVCFASYTSADAGLFHHRSHGCGCAPASCAAPAPSCAAPAACAPSCAAPAACAPTCAAPAACAPTCAAPVAACAPTCAAPVAACAPVATCAPVCNSCCGHKHCFKLPKIKCPKIRCCKVRKSCCNTGCAPSCAAPAACAPTCAAPAACAPTCAAPAAACAPSCAAPVACCR